MQIHPTYYEVMQGYWKSSLHTFLVTDDVLYAREQVLEEMLRQLSTKTVKENYRRFDDTFQVFLKDESEDRSFFFSYNEYHFQIRVAQLRVAVTPLSTIIRSR